MRHAKAKGKRQKEKVKEKAFIGISFGVINDRVCAVATSDGDTLAALDGLSSADALTFLWFKLKAENPKVKVLPVMYDSAVDLELLFHDLSKRQKDVFYNLIGAMEEQNIAEENPLADLPSRVINHAGFEVCCIPGKILQLKRPGVTRLIISDLGSFFEGRTVADTCSALAIKNETEAIEKNLLPLWTAGLLSEIGKRCVNEAKAVALVADRVRSTLTEGGLTPSSWYGPSAVAGHCLNKWGARKQAKNLHQGNAASELLKAIDVAYIGGRVELLKLGTFQDVRTFDLNSAYAYAVTLLSQFYLPLRFTREYDSSAPFACWLVDYQLPESVTLGILPNRSTKGAISFGLRGRGYFWQPEVDYLRQRFPGSFTVKWGYVAPKYQQVTFAPEVQKMYDYRNVLKERGDKAEKIIKLALANLYGKFAQNKGRAHYQCRAWAGWITSLVRRLLLESVTGIEDRVISINQDAVHLAGVDARVTVGSGLGEWKAACFDEGFYAVPGFYDLRMKGESVKTAARGSNLDIDYTRIATDLSNRQVSQLSRQFFVGWQMARQAPVKYGSDYLQEVTEALDLIPSRMQARTYQTEFNWNTENRDSAINRHWSGLLSARYRPNDSVSNGLRLRLKDRQSQWR